MILDDYKYNRANITAFRLIKTDSPFHKSVALNLSDYYFNNANDKSQILLKTKNALMFDSIFAFSAAIKEAEKHVNLYEGNVSCPQNKHLSYGSTLRTFFENVNFYTKNFLTMNRTFLKRIFFVNKIKISVRGLTGLIKFQNKQRREFDLDVLQLKESGLFKVCFLITCPV